MQRRQGKFYLPRQEPRVEKDAELESGQGRTVFVDAEQWTHISSHLRHRKE